jgi:hypothetical protein
MTFYKATYHTAPHDRDHRVCGKRTDGAAGRQGIFRDGVRECTALVI